MDKKHPSAKEYAEKIKYNMHVMYWKYNYPCIVSCACGSQDFEVSYYQTDPTIRNGQIEIMPGSIVKKLLCQKCGDYYEDAVFKQADMSGGDSTLGK